MRRAHQYSLLRKVVFCAISVVGFGSSAAFSAEVYTYTGPNYSFCSGTYVGNCASDHLTGSFTTTLSLSQLENLTSYTVPVSDIASFSFSDGNGLTLSQANATVSNLGITTDSLGRILWWVVGFDGSGGPNILIRTSSCLPSTCPGGFTGGNDFSETSLANEGSTIFEPFGQIWSGPAASTPEASGGLLVGIGFMILAGFGVIRRLGAGAKQQSR